jgi:hypothetical protein
MSNNHPYPAGYGLHPDQRQSYKQFKHGLGNLVFNQKLNTFALDLKQLQTLSNIINQHAAEIVLDMIDVLDQRDDKITDEMINILLDFVATVT